MGYLNLFLEQLKYSWSQKVSLQVTTLLVMMGSFMVVTVTALVLSNTNHLFKDISESFQVSVYLTDQGDLNDEKSKIKSLINKTGMFSDISYVSKKDALKDFKIKMKDQLPSSLMEENDVNPLPASFALKIKKQFSNQLGFEKVSSFSESLLAEIGIEDVEYGKSWVNQYASILSSYNIGSFIFIMFLFISVLMVVGNSIRSSISQRKREIEVLELVGATRAYIRMPFILEGAFMGLVSSVGSILITYMFYKSVVSFSASGNGNILFSNLNIEFLSALNIFLICFSATTIGAIGAALSIRKMNTGWAALGD